MASLLPNETTALPEERECAARRDDKLYVADISTTQRDDNGRT
jgi:hypothetical protein